MAARQTILILLFFFLCNFVFAQADAAGSALENVSPKYLKTVTSKADKYYKRISSKTEKTLERLVVWENKIKKILEKTSPETAQNLFGPDRITFATILQKYKEGKVQAGSYMAEYDQYRDKLTNTVKYLDDKKDQLKKNLVQPVEEAHGKLAQLNNQLENTEAVEQFIRERKRQLVQQAFQYIGKSRLFQNMDKETYYYVETLRNYRELFSEPKKIEQLTVKLLQKIPAFNEFIQENSILSSLFASSAGNANPNGTIGFLQSRSSVQAVLQNQLQAAGANPQAFLQQAGAMAKEQMNRLKQLVSQLGQSGSDFEVPNFKPNPQRSKTFGQKIELSANFQSTKHNNLFPVSSDIGLSIGYKPSDKYIIGLGTSYRVGWGNSLRNIRITHQGIGLRSFIDLRIKGGLFASGGYEQNYFNEIKSIQQLKELSAWKSSAVIGLSKKYSIGKKKKGEVKILYDFFHASKNPRTQPVLFRLGYGL